MLTSVHAMLAAIVRREPDDDDDDDDFPVFEQHVDGARVVDVLRSVEAQLVEAQSKTIGCRYDSFEL